MTNAAHCAALVREYDRDRYLASLFAPADKRDALTALAAFDVEIARVRAAAREPMPGEIRLQWWREALSGARDSETAAHPVAAALRAALGRGKIDPAPLIGLIDARAFALYDAPLATLDDLDAYGAATDGALIAVAAAILGVGDTGAAPPAGIALTIARLFAELPRRPAIAQLLLPDEVVVRHGVSRARLSAGEGSDASRAACAELVRHARRQLQAVQAAVPPAAMQPALLPLAPVGPQLRRLDRAGFDPFARGLALSPWRRQWLIWRAARDPKRMLAA